MTKLQNKLKGFTLLELVIVIAIIGILAVIVLPNFIQALAKARDAKKMTELRGVQTFLTTIGIDTQLRYPRAQDRLAIWMVNSGNRLPSALATATTQDITKYHYVGADCSSTTYVKTPGTSNSDEGETCSSYQLWVELESDNAALSLDADFDATNASSSALAAEPNKMDGRKESCTNKSTIFGNFDCVFDLVP